MNVTEAAKVYRDLRPRRDELNSQLKPAEEVLKEYFRRTGKSAFRGVRYARSTFTRLDTKIARRLLGKKAAEAEVQGERESLSIE